MFEFISSMDRNISLKKVICTYRLKDSNTYTYHIWMSKSKQTCTMSVNYFARIIQRQNAFLVFLHMDGNIWNHMTISNINASAVYGLLFTLIRLSRLQELASNTGNFSCQNRDHVCPSAAFPLLLSPKLRGIGLAWYVTMLRSPRMQGPLGSTACAQISGI